MESALLNTVHSATATQYVVDSVSQKKDLRSGRSAVGNIIPATTGAATATTKVLPDLQDKFDGIALRVPTIAGSVADLTFISKKKTTVKEVNEVLEKASGNLFAVTHAPIVSSDIVGETFISVADLSMTRVVNGNLVKILLWYDNEMGYTQSLLEHTRVL